MKQENYSSGQSTIEYLLLTAVIVSLLLAVFNSNLYRDLLGAEGSILAKSKNFLEHTYRHSYPIPLQNAEEDPKTLVQNYFSINHASYFYNGRIRFFIPEGAYPQ